MKDMKFKIICLMLVIPLLLIFATGTVVKVSDVYVDIPVSKVEIKGSKDVQKDIAADSDGNKYDLSAVVYPENATHKNVSYILSSGDENGIEIDGNKVIAKKAGEYTITAVAGQCTDSVKLKFYSSKPTGLNYAQGAICEDGKAKVEVKRGTAVKLIGTAVENLDNATVYFKTEDSARVVVNGDKIVGLKASETAVKVEACVEGVEYNQADKSFEEKTFCLPIDVYVDELSADEVVVSGFEENENVVKKSQTAVFEIFYGESVDANEWELDYNKDDFDVTAENVTKEKKYVVTVTWHDGESVSKKEQTITVTQGGKNVCALNVEYSDTPIVIDFPDIVDIDKWDYVDAEYNGVSVYSESVGREYNLSVSVSPDASNKVNRGGNGKYRVKTAAEKEYTVTVKLTSRTGDKEYEASKQFKSLDPIVAISLDSGYKENGLKNQIAVGGYKFGADGTPIENTVKLNAVAKTHLGKMRTDFDIVWDADESLIQLSGDSTSSKAAKIMGDGLVTVTVSSKRYSSVKASVELYCVNEGIEVADYNELMRVNYDTAYSGGKLSNSANGGYATEGYCSVLIDDIMMAPALKESDNVQDYVLQMKPTADIKYYGNNSPADAEALRLNYAMEIAASIYGNGHYICADYITRNGGKKSNPVYKGPIDLVRYLYAKNATTDESNVYIKSQDNIVFAVLKDNIKVDNAELKGCLDKSLTDDGASEANLGNLDNVGTVLEVVGNNFEITYSKINNGRTVMRVYGESAATPAKKGENRTKEGFGRTNVNISNCILSYGREFLLKVGTNRIKRTKFTAYDNGKKYLRDVRPMPSGDTKHYYDEAAPYFTDANGKKYAVGNDVEKNGDAKAYDEYFYDNYVLTNIVVSDTAFAASGLFCIGMDSMFGGLCLHGWDYNQGDGAINYEFGSKLGWGGISGTSYPAKISLTGDVRFYDWKDVSKVDSSTLVTGSQRMISLIGLDMNVSKLLTKFYENKDNGEQAANLITRYNGISWVNGAIAFYGGGKNYSIIDDSGLYVDADGKKKEGISSRTKLLRYSVGIENFVDSGKESFVYYTAGPNPFRFMMYGATDDQDMDKLTPQMQDNYFRSNTAYTFLMRKK